MTTTITTEPPTSTVPTADFAASEDDEPLFSIIQSLFEVTEYETVPPLSLVIENCCAERSDSKLSLLTLMLAGSTSLSGASTGLQAAIKSAAKM